MWSQFFLFKQLKPIYYQVCELVMLLHSSHTVTPQKESELTQKWVICDKLLKRCLRSDNGDDGYYILIFMYLHVRKREISCFLRSCWHKFLDRKLYCWRRGNHLSKNSTDSSVCLWTLFAQFLLFHSSCFLIMGYVEVSKYKEITDILYQLYFRIKIK